MQKFQDNSLDEYEITYSSEDEIINTDSNDALNESEIIMEGEENSNSSDSGFFSLKELTLTQDFSMTIAVKKLLTTIPVRRPDKQKFFRINPDPLFQLSVATIEVKEENETYIVHPQIFPDLAGECSNRLLVTGITRQKNLFVWPIGLPGPDGKDNPWHNSAREAAEHAKKAWIRLVSNRELGAYEILEASGDLGEPEFPDLSMEDIIKIAFKDKIIYSIDHPLLKNLRGCE